MKKKQRSIHIICDICFKKKKKKTIRQHLEKKLAIIAKNVNNYNYDAFVLQQVQELSEDQDIAKCNQIFDLTYLAEDHWWGFGIPNAHMVHIVN